MLQYMLTDVQLLGQEPYYNIYSRWLVFGVWSQTVSAEILSLKKHMALALKLSLTLTSMQLPKFDTSWSSVFTLYTRKGLSVKYRLSRLATSLKLHLIYSRQAIRTQQLDFRFFKMWGYVCRFIFVIIQLRSI